MMRKLLSVLAPLALWFASAHAASTDPGVNPPLLLRYPTVSRTEIAFNYAGDLWVVSRAGGEARQLTSGIGTETVPHFSPDGGTIAFTGEYDGNRDVYIVPVTGGVPRRLTYHPAEEIVLGWTPDGTRVLFSSTATSGQAFERQLYTVPVGGGLPTQLPLPMGVDASFAPDGEHLAYVPFPQAQQAWKRYRGGQTTPIWLADLEDSSIVKVPRENSNDHHPMWVGDRIYFLSDRNGPVSLFAYEVKSRAVSEALHAEGFDFKTASAGPDAIVIEQFGAIKLYVLATHQAHDVTIRVSADVASVRPHFAKVDPKRIRNFGFSPSGVRAVFEAWGEIFTVPTDKGDIRNLTRTPAVADRDPAWSPDGKSIAYFSDASGEYALYIRDQSGLGDVRRIALGDPPSFFYEPIWSPDSRHIAYTDKRLALWYVDVQTGARRRIDEQYYDGFGVEEFSEAWSPDSQWLAYARQLPSGLHALFVYSLAQGKSFQLTDGLSDASHPVFDRNGKYLYFMASTDSGRSVQELDMSSDEHRVVRSVYAAVLSKDEPSPLAPQSDEEKGAPEEGKAEGRSGGKPEGKAQGKSDKDGHAPSPVVATRIDIEGIGQRIIALPIPPKNYLSLQGGKSGVLFLAEAPDVLAVTADGAEVPQVLQRFDLGKRKLEKLLDEVNDFMVSFDGTKVLYRKATQWSTASSEAPPSAPGPQPGIGPLKLEGWQVYVEPRAMWKQMYDETWRIERDFFYDPHYHGLDLAKAKRKYAPYVAGLASREELTYLLDECLGELTVGHLFVRGGDQAEVAHVNVGMLGADYRLESGRYRIARVYDGENWNPTLQAPLTQPGVNVHAGDYLLAVNSRELRASDNVYDFFQGLAGKQVVLRVGPNPDGSGSREVTVLPIDNEAGLRHLARIEDNRRKVDEMTGGRVAYVYLPDTAGDGFNSFNRYFFAQVGKEAVILDERSNRGGQLADYIIENLRRPVMSRLIGREGHERSSPSQAIYGPKVMIIDERAGSGGDALPWYFRKAGLGPLVGKRTWGGLVGIGGYPELIDGGTVTAPRVALYGLNGEWEVENHGIAPDYDVDLDPQAWRDGHDTQLEKAIEVVLQQLKAHPTPQFPRPAYPNYHPHDDLSAAP
jgi:tricorn protease